MNQPAQSVQLKQYTTAYVLPTHETDIGNLWRPDAIFHLMQEMAGAHADRLGFGRDALLERGIVWMLARVHLRMERMPMAHETVQATTWPGPVGRATFPRYFTFADAEGRPLGAASSSWMLVDLEKRRIVPSARANLDFPDTSAFAPPMPEPARFSLETEGDPSLAERTPLYGDIDVNGHMNNARYAAWIADLFPLERHREGWIAELLIHYAAEIAAHEPMRLALLEANDRFEVRGTAGERTIFEAKGRWAKH